MDCMQSKLCSSIGLNLLQVRDLWFALQVKKQLVESHGTWRGHITACVSYEGPGAHLVMLSTLACWGSAALTEVAIWIGGCWKKFNHDCCS